MFVKDFHKNYSYISALLKHSNVSFEIFYTTKNISVNFSRLGHFCGWWKAWVQECQEGVLTTDYIPTHHTYPQTHSKTLKYLG